MPDNHRDLVVMWMLAPALGVAILALTLWISARWGSRAADSGDPAAPVRLEPWDPHEARAWGYSGRRCAGCASLRTHWTGLEHIECEACTLWTITPPEPDRW